MGSQKDVLKLFAERDIRQVFSEREGWRMSQMDVSPSTGSFYRLSRYKWGGDEVAFISVSFDPAPKKESLSAFDTLPDVRAKKYLLTPQATDTTDIPSEVRILPMSAFTFTDGNLVWLTKKKHARRISPEPAVVA
jgi:hypothetical protein